MRLRERVMSRPARWAVLAVMVGTGTLARAGGPRHEPLSLIERTPTVATALAQSEPLAALLVEKRAALARSAAGCTAPGCIDDALRWTDPQITAAAEALKHAYATSEEVRRLVDGALRDSGTYIRDAAAPGDELLARAWTEAAHGVNMAIDVYGKGREASRYAKMDPPLFDVRSKAYARLLHSVAEVLADESPDMTLFFQPTLRYALHVLDLNGRDEAGRLEPLDDGENAAALAAIPGVRWSRFAYTVILVPGSGPDRLTWPLSPAGKLRVEIAARRWSRRKAPLILVSGGFVHPSRTPYAEAIEMKRSLIEDFGVPESAILIDPHARHTTTNLRNAARLLYRYRVPFDRPALISTDSQQSAYIESEEFRTRCEEELGYVPYRLGRRVSGFDLEWTPRIQSLQIDPVGDLLDP